MLLNYFFVMLGGALGSGARFWASSAITNRCGGTFPFGTIAVNITSCFVIGFFAALADPQGDFSSRRAGGFFSALRGFVWVKN